MVGTAPAGVVLEPESVLPTSCYRKVQLVYLSEKPKWWTDAKTGVKEGILRSSVLNFSVDSGYPDR